jgi:hypothetical protein
VIGVAGDAAALPPPVAVVPDIATLDLQTGDASPFDRDDEVDLVILQVTGDALAGDDSVIWPQLFEQCLVVDSTVMAGRSDGRQICVFASRASVEM